VCVCVCMCVFRFSVSDFLAYYPSINSLKWLKIAKLDSHFFIVNNNFCKLHLNFLLISRSYNFSRIYIHIYKRIYKEISQFNPKPNFFQFTKKEIDLIKSLWRKDQVQSEIASIYAYNTTYVAQFSKKHNSATIVHACATLSIARSFVQHDEHARFNARPTDQK